jgi:SAM-dependent methyltransferase
MRQLRFGRSGDAGAQPLDPALVDGLPVPPPHLIYLIGGTTNPNAYLHGGMRVGRAIRDMLSRNGVDITALRAVLDFGCGCGRVVRQWKDLTRTRIHGTDYNRQLVRWCRRHLRFATFGVNRLAPPLDYPDGAFDFVYAFSVFTHLTEPLQFAWMKELHRVLAPGGYLLISVHGESYLPKLGEADQQKFRAGEMLMFADYAAGTNRAAAFHPERYVRERLAQGFDTIDMMPGAVDQDFYLFKKR